MVEINVEMEKEKKSVDLGVLNTDKEDQQPWRLHRKHFPSKVGGPPAWLDPHNLPKPDHLTCGRCNKPMIFLCQIYCPINDNDECFHRSLFLFICAQGECCRRNENQNIAVFRCQLRRDNDFYDYEPVDEDDESPDDDSKLSSLCLVCGCAGPNHCAKCKIAKYCSREHQVFDWKNGHKEKCGVENNSELRDKNNRLRFPEWELFIEEESEEERKNVSEKDEMAHLQRLIAEKKAGSLVNESEEELEQYTNKDVEDKTFTKFKKRVDRNPEQVLRYDRGGEPLWISSQDKLGIENVPKCDSCASDRLFECQIMPQLLNFLNIDVGEHSIDWGILAIYTCKNNCNDGQSYKREYVYKQDIST